MHEYLFILRVIATSKSFYSVIGISIRLATLVNIIYNATFVARVTTRPTSLMYL